MSSDSLHDRGRALEDAFFAKQSAEKLKKLRESMAAKQAVEELAKQTGIGDVSLLQKVVDLGVRPETLAAFALVPLLYVAWADGVLDLKEKEALRVEALALGLEEGGPGMELLESWLTSKPDDALFASWKTWIAELEKGLDPASRVALGATLLENARRIARSSGGLFGIGAVSSEEHAAITELREILGAE